MDLCEKLSCISWYQSSWSWSSLSSEAILLVSRLYFRDSNFGWGVNLGGLGA